MLISYNILVTSYVCNINGIILWYSYVYKVIHNYIHIYRHSIYLYNNVIILTYNISIKIYVLGYLFNTIYIICHINALYYVIT